MIELVKNKEDCCGCRTCELVCPKGAIQMKADKCGFMYPEVSKLKCVDCGLCLKSCAFQSGYKQRKEYEPFYAYGARHKEQRVYMNSRSGGAFTALSDVIIAADGVIYGAGFDKEKGVAYISHQRAVKKIRRNKFRGSKYVQSDLSGIFLKVKQDLESGRKVLFTGTGCQVGALYSYLKKEYENLYTAEILCHGTPSPKLWAEFIAMREQELNGKVEMANFRNKRGAGWKAHRETLQVNGERHHSRIWAKLFQMGMARPSCYKCIYANENRVADITLADFWGYKNVIPGIWEDNKGISLVLVNNTKGMELWNRANQAMDIVDCTGHEFQHTNLHHPTAKPETYDAFWKDYKKKGFVYCVGKYAEYEAQIEKKSIFEKIRKNK